MIDRLLIDSGVINYRVTTLPEKSWNLVRPFSSLESHGKQPRSWIVMENDDDVLEFL